MNAERARGRPTLPSHLWYLAAFALAAAVALLLLTSPRPAEAMTAQLISFDTESNDDYEVTINLPAIPGDQMYIAHVVGGSEEDISCIESSGGWTGVLYEDNGGGSDHASAIFYRVGPWGGGDATFSLWDDGSGTSTNCGSDPSDNGDQGITVAVTRWSGIDVTDPIHGAADSSSDGTSTAPNVTNAPANSLVLRFFSYERFDTGPNDSPRVVAGNSNSDCSNSNNPNIGRIYGAPIAPGGDDDRPRTLGAFMFTQASQGNTGSFTASYCEDFNSRRTPDSISMTVVLNVPWTPEVTKEGRSAQGNTVRWEIEVDNDAPDNQHERDVRVRFSESANVDFGGHPDCNESNGVITCQVDAGDEIDFWVTMDVERTCETQTFTNQITNLEVQYRYSGGNWTAWESLPDPDPATASIDRGEGYCLPDNYVIPLPIPSPVGDPSPPPSQGTPPPSGTPGACEVAAATWSPTPVVPGRTISTWGGGNVSQFPAKVATSYWTTVGGKFVGYIPGAPAWVNTTFFSAFPNGDIPACTAFVVFHRP